MIKLPVKALPSNDNGRLLIRLHHKYRGEVSRFGIVQLTNVESARNVKALVLGHDDNTAIFMPFDVRRALDVEKGGELEFTIQKVGWAGKLIWLLQSPDPAVHVPSWLALISVALGIVGVSISLFD